jgi:hypothetical protein
MLPPDPKVLRRNRYCTATSESNLQIFGSRYPRVERQVASENRILDSRAGSRRHTKLCALPERIFRLHCSRCRKHSPAAKLRRFCASHFVFFAGTNRVCLVTRLAAR